METTAIYHRPDSEYAYLYTPTEMHVRLRTKKDDVKTVNIIGGDPYLIHEEHWYRNHLEMTKVLSTDLHDYWQITVSSKFRRYQYGFHCIGIDGEEVFYCDRGVYPFTEDFTADAKMYFRMPFFHKVDMFKAPEWVKGTVWYQIFPERFANGDTSNDPENTLPWGSKIPGREDFFGGDLQGVLDNLDYLESLGINGIYFCPVFEASTNHKYDTNDYYEIDSHFGDKKIFRKLVDELHARGMRIMIDAVFNHIGHNSPIWQDVVKNEEKSKYADWFHIRSYPVGFGENGNHEMATTLSFDTFSFTPTMPKLNTENPEVQEYLLDIAKYWIKEFNIDAWRLDVANEVDHHFWKRFYSETTALKEDFYILGEIWHSSQSWLQGDEFHAVMNYAFTDMMQDFFVHKKISASKMVAGMNEQLMLYRDQTNQVMFNLLDSHDTARLLTQVNGDKDLLKSVFSLMFLQHGAPCIYYGTEIGMDGANDPDCRKCMEWDTAKQDLELFTFFQQMIAMRKENQELVTYGTLNWLEVDDENKVVVVERSNEHAKITGIYNQGTTEKEYEVSGNIALENLVSKDTNKVTIAPGGFLIYISK